MEPVAILGAGLAGLTAARELHRRGIPFEVYEAKGDVAGLASSFVENGFTYDFGAHFITNRLAEEIGVLDQCRTVRYYGESVHLSGADYSYPFGLIATPRFLMSALRTRFSAVGNASIYGSAVSAFEHNYGKRLAQEVAIPLTEAWSGASASLLAASVTAKLPMSLLSVLALKLGSKIRRKAFAIGYSREKPEGFRVWHVYPNGGLRLLCDALASDFRDKIHLNSPVAEVKVEDSRVYAIRVGDSTIPVSAVVSTLPCSLIPKLVTGTESLRSLERFRFRPMVFVMMRFKTANILPDVVVWTPEAKYPFFRLTETPKSMPWLAPEGKTLITADIGCQVGDSTWKMSDDELGGICLSHLEQIAPKARNRYLGCRVLRTPFAYPIFLSEYEDQRKQWQQDTGIAGLYSIGRNGEFDHLLTEDVYWRTIAKMNALSEFRTKAAALAASKQGS